MQFQASKKNVPKNKRETDTEFVSTIMHFQGSLLLWMVTRCCVFPCVWKLLLLADITASRQYLFPGILTGVPSLMEMLAGRQGSNSVYAFCISFTLNEKAFKIAPQAFKQIGLLLLVI